MKQDQLAAAQGDIVASLVGLYKALGGGWEIRYPGYPLRGIDPLPSASGQLQRLPQPALGELPAPVTSDVFPPPPPTPVTPSES